LRNNCGHHWVWDGVTHRWQPDIFLYFIILFIYYFLKPGTITLTKLIAIMKSFITIENLLYDFYKIYGFHKECCGSYSCNANDGHYFFY